MPFTFDPKKDAYVYDPKGKLKLPPGPPTWSKSKPQPKPQPEKKAPYVIKPTT